MHLKLLSSVKSGSVLFVVFIAIIIYNISDMTYITLAKLNDNSINQNNNSISSNSNGTDVKQITLKWLISNETKPDNSFTIRVSSQDFWKIFGPLLQLSINE